MESQPSREVTVIPERLYRLIGELIAFTVEVDSAWTGGGGPDSEPEVQIRLQGEVPRQCSTE